MSLQDWIVEMASRDLSDGELSDEQLDSNEVSAANQDQVGARLLVLDLNRDNNYDGASSFSTGAEDIEGACPSHGG